MGESIVYSIPYVLLILLYGFMAAIYPSDRDDARAEALKGYLHLASIALFVVFFGFRGYVSDDWTNYYYMYDRCSYNNLQDLIYSMQDMAYEPGFFLLTLICKIVSGGNYVFYQLVCNLILLALLWRFLRRYIANIPLGFMLFICMGGFVMSINLLRNSISIMIFANALHLIRERRALRYFGVCLLALCFHYSAALYIPLYFFFHKRLPRTLYLALIIFVNLLVVLRIHIVSGPMLVVASSFGEVYEKLLYNYIEGKYEGMQSALSIGFLERLLSAVLIYCYYDKLSKVREDSTLLINCFIAYVFCNQFFFEFQVFAQRIALLFTIAYWVLWSDLIHTFFIDNNRRLFKSFVGLYCVLKIIGLTHLETFAYDNHLFGAASYEERRFIHQKYEDDEE